MDRLEQRVLLNSTLTAVNDFALYDSSVATPNDVNAVVLYGASGGISVAVNYTNGANDLIDLVITDSTAGANASTVSLLATGPINSITFTGNDPDDQLNLTVQIDQVSDLGGGGWGDSLTALNGAFLGLPGTDQTLPADLTNAIADGDVLTADGNIGATTENSELAGGNVLMTNYGPGNVGSYTINNSVDLTGGAVMVVTQTATQAGATTGGVTITGDVRLGANNLAITQFTNNTNAAAVSVADNNEIFVDGAGSLVVTTDNNQNLGSVNLGTVRFDGTGDVTVQPNNGVGNIDIAGSVTVDGVEFQDGANGSDLVVYAAGTGDITGSVQVGAVTWNTDDAGDNGDVRIGQNATQAIGAVSFGAITNNAQNGATDVQVTADTIASLTFSTITFSGTGTQLGDVLVTAAGNIGGNLSFGNMLFGDAGVGGVPEAGGSIVSVQSGGTVNDINFQDITVNTTAGVSVVNIAATDAANVNVASTWTFNGSGDVTIDISSGVDSAFGNIGGVNWDILFTANEAANASVYLLADDGMGTLTIDQVDHVDPTRGGLYFNLNADADADAPVGTIIVRARGNDATNEVVWGNNSVLIGEANGSTITLAGGVGAGGAFAAIFGDDDNDGWGAVRIGWDTVAGAAVNNSDFDGQLWANDGIVSFTVEGVGSSVGVSGLASIHANFDGLSEDSTLGVGFLPVGSLGPVNVEGESNLGLGEGFMAQVVALDMDNFVLTNGVWNAILVSGGDPAHADGFSGTIATQLDRQNITSNIGTIQVGTLGTAARVNSGSLFADDGIGAVTVQSVTPYLGDVVLDNILTDRDAVDTGAAIGGGFGGLTAPGQVTIGQLDTDGVDDNANRASQNSGPILAGQHITIFTLDIGGSMPSITTQYGFVQALDDGTAPGSLPVPPDDTPDITIVTLAVNGDLDRIATTGLASEDITITNASTIYGDLDTIDAGLGMVSIPAGLTVQTGTTTTPVYIITDLGIDYILAVAGTFTGGSINSTATFPADAGVIGSRSEVDGDEPTLAISDIDGITSFATTELIVATRQEGVAYTAADDASEEWDVLTIQDTDNDQHDFHLIRLEGDLLGPIGADNNNFDGVPGTVDPTRSLGNLNNVEIQGLWNNGGAASIFALSLNEISFGAVAVTPITLDVADNTNGTVQDLEIYNSFAALSGTDVVIAIPDGGSITKLFVGPTGALETIRFTDTDFDGVINTVVIDFSAGMITDIHLFGEHIGIEYNALDPANPATNANTNIFYGYDQAGLTATTFMDAGMGSEFLIDFLEFSSAIGNIDVNDTDTADMLLTSVDRVLVGYAITLDSAADTGNPRDWINDQNDGTGNGTVRTTAANAVVYAGVNNVMVDGEIFSIVTSGGVGNLTTNANGLDADGDGVPDARLRYIVTDGSAGTINVDGHVWSALVVGDPVVLDIGADALLGTADDTIGINGTPGFTGPINVAGSLGVVPGETWHVDTSLPASDANVRIQAPATAAFDYTTTRAAIIANLGAAYSWSQVSAPDGIGVNITVGENLGAAVISGKRILVDTGEDQSDDDISGNISASEINADIWSGDDINGDHIQARGDGMLLAVADPARYGGITGGLAGPNAIVNIQATGASPGDILADILAAGNITNIWIEAGSQYSFGFAGGSGGSLLADVIAGTDGTGGFTGTNNIHADDDIGVGPNGNVVSSADAMALNQVWAGLQTTDDPITPDPVDGGDINSDFLAGVPIGDTVPVGAAGSSFLAGINDSNLPIMQNEDDSITITDMQAGWQVDTDLDGVATNDMDSDLNGTLVAASSITINLLQIDGDAIGNDGVPGGHIAQAGNGWLGGTSTLMIGGGTVTGTLYGMLTGGMLVPFDDEGPSPLDPNDLGQPLSGAADGLGFQAGTALTLADVSVTLTVGQWDGSAQGVSGADGINLLEVVTGAESLANATYTPVGSVAATGNVAAAITAAGLPWQAPQTGTGSVSPDPATGDIIDVSIWALGGITGAVTALDMADLNLVMSNIDAITSFMAPVGDPSSPSTSLAFNSGTAGHNALDVTAMGNGVGGLYIEWMTAGLDPFVLIDANPPVAGAPVQAMSTDPRVPSLRNAFGFGDLEGRLRSIDSDRTNGLETGDIELAVWAAGEDIDGVAWADDDVVFHVADGNLDVIPGFMNGADLDVAAGMNTLSLVSPLGESGNFNGGDIDGSSFGGQLPWSYYILAGDDVYADNSTGGNTSAAGADPFVAVIALGTDDGSGGDIDARIGSHWEDQVWDTLYVGDQLPWSDEYEADNDPREALTVAAGAGGLALPAGLLVDDGDLLAVMVAASDIDQNIDAGSWNGSGGGNGALFHGGSFVGTAVAGAGIDLDIFNIVDNDQDGIMDDIYAANDILVNLPNWAGDPSQGYLGGILSEDDIDTIVAGFGIIDDGVLNRWNGDLVGPVVAEGDIDVIEVTGNIGLAANDYLIAAGGTIHHIYVGDAPEIADGSSELAGDTNDDDAYIGTRGILYSSVFMGNKNDSVSGIEIFVGGAIIGNMVLGTVYGIEVLEVQIGSDLDVYYFGEGRGTFFIGNGDLGDDGDVDAPNLGQVDILAYGDGALELWVDNVGTGTGASIHQLIVGDTLDELHVTDGAVGQIIVDDDYDAAGYLADGLSILPDLTTYPFLVGSLPSEGEVEQAFNNDKFPINADIINVDYNIGVDAIAAGVLGETLEQSIDRGLLADMSNVAIWVQGTITGLAESTTGSIGNVYVGGIRQGDPALIVVGLEGDLTAQNSIGDILVNAGGLVHDLDDDGFVDEDRSIVAVTGSVGVISVQYGLDVNVDADGDGDIEVYLDAAENLGGLISREGWIQADLHTHGSIGLLIASDDIWGSYTAETGSVGIDLEPDGADNFMFDAVTGLAGATGIYSYAGNIGGYAKYFSATDVDIPLIGGSEVPGVLLINQTLSITAGTDVGNIEAHVGNVGVTIDPDMLRLDVFPPTFTFDRVYADIILPVVDPVVTITAGDNIGAVTAGSSIGWEAYGYGLDGNPTKEDLLNPDDLMLLPVSFVTLRAQRGGIGDLTAVSGNVDIYATAQDVADIAAFGDIRGIVEAGNSIGALDAGGDVDGAFVAQEGDVGPISGANVYGSYTAGSTIQAIVAALDVDAVLNAGALIDGIEALVGNVTVTARSGLDMGGIQAPLGWVDADVAVVGDFGTMMAIDSTLNLYNVGVLAGLDVMGSYLSTQGSVGGLISTAGNVGSADAPVDVRANGGVEIDPFTLEYTVVAPADRGGVGVIYAEIGSVYANVTTGGNVGVQDFQMGGDPDHIVGGIAAPIGMIDVGLNVGGHVGGVSAQSVSLHGVGGGESIVLGVIGILRNADLGTSGSVQGIDSSNPFVLISDNVEYMVAITAGGAMVDYSIDEDGWVTFSNVTYQPAAAGTNSIAVTTAFKGDDVPVPATVDQLLVSDDADGVSVEGNVALLAVNGNVTTVLTEGDLDEADIAGNVTSLTVGGGLGVLNALSLSGSTVNVTESIDAVDVQGSITNTTIAAGQGIGSVHAGGNIGLAYGAINPFKPDDVTITAPEIGSINAAGTNYGLINATLGKQEWLTWLNPHSTSADDQFITAYLQAGAANLSINFGALETVAFTEAKTPKNFVVLTDSEEYDDATDTDATVKTNANRATEKLLRSQYKLVKKGVSMSGHGANIITNLVLENGRTSDGGDNALVGEIILATTDPAKGGSKGLQLNGLLVEGGVGSIGRIGTKASSLKDTWIVGDVGAINLIDDMKNVNVGGDLGSLTADKVTDLTVDGSVGSMTVNDINTLAVDSMVERISAARSIQKAVLGGAGIIAAGDSIKKLSVDSGMLELSAKKMSDVSIGGGIGLVVDAAGNVVFNPSGLADPMAVLGGSASDIGDAGPVAGNLYIGGLEADSVKNVSVAGDVVDVTIHDKASNLGLDALTQAIDDAFVRLNSKIVLIKEDGVLVNWDQLDDTPDAR